MIAAIFFLLLTKQPDRFSVFFLPDGAMASGAQRKWCLRFFLFCAC